MSETVYHYRIEVRLACGCYVERFVDAGTEPSGGEAYMYALDLLTNDSMISLMLSEQHTERGSERVSIDIKTMVGQCPGQEEA